MNTKIIVALAGVLALVAGGGFFVYEKYLKPSSSFMDEYRNAQSRIIKMDSLLRVSNLKIDSSLKELGKIKDSINTIQNSQKESNRLVNDAVVKMQNDLKKYYSNLNASKSSLSSKNKKIDSLESVLEKLKPN